MSHTYTNGLLNVALVREATAKLHEHILINRIRLVASPVSLNGTATAVRAYVTSEAAARNSFAKTINVSIER